MCCCRESGWRDCSGRYRAWFHQASIQRLNRYSLCCCVPVEGLQGSWCILVNEQNDGKTEREKALCMHRCVEMPENTKICHLRSNMGDWLVDTLLPRLVSPSPASASPLGARRQDIIVLNFAVWINYAQARTALGFCCPLGTAFGCRTRAARTPLCSTEPCGSTTRRRALRWAPALLGCLLWEGKRTRRSPHSLVTVLLSLRPALRCTNTDYLVCLICLI